MRIVIEGDPKEIAAFLMETGKRHNDDGCVFMSKSPAHRNLSGDELDPYHLPVVVALSARELGLLKAGYAEKANRPEDGRET